MNKKRLLKDQLHRLWMHIPVGRRAQFGLLLVVMLLASIAEVVSIGAVLPFLGVITNPEFLFSNSSMRPLIQLLNVSAPDELLLPLTIAFSLAALFSGVMRLILLWIQTRLSHAVGADISIDIYRRTLYQPYAVHVSRNSSEVVAGISTKANQVVNYTILPVMIIISSVLILVAILSTLILIEPRVALIAITGFGSVYGSIIFLMKKKLSRNSKLISREQSQIFKALQEGLGGIRDVLIDGAQEIYCRIYRKADLPLRRALANVQIIGGSPRFLIEALGMILIAVLAYSLTTEGSQFEGTIPILGAFALGAQRMLPVLQQSYNSWSLIKGNEITLNDALELLDQPLPDRDLVLESLPIEFNSELRIRNLGFRYTENSPWIIRDLELSIPKGSSTGIIGTTGSGKSTFLDIVMGLLQPTEGKVTVDGVPLSKGNNRNWQAHVAHVPQSIFLADVSIAENIAFGVPANEIDYEKVELAAENAQIASTIETMGQKYQSQVGERGIRLSGGQRQRIGIARALYKDADVIVFDEATSALDNKTEQEVMNAIENMGGDITIIIVAHRLSTLKKCSNIVELENGNVNRIGTYDEFF